MDQQTSKPVSLIRRHAADALRRARKLPIGHARNNLRQLAMGLLWLERKGFVATVNEGKLDLRKTNDLRESPHLAASSFQKLIKKRPQLGGA